MHAAWEGFDVFVASGPVLLMPVYVCVCVLLNVQNFIFLVKGNATFHAAALCHCSRRFTKLFYIYVYNTPNGAWTIGLIPASNNYGNIVSASVEIKIIAGK